MILLFRCLKPLNLNHKHEKTIVAALLLANAGLIFVDHIHFQYNGFLFGVLLLSIGFMLREQFLMSALLFCILLNLKHIFIYIAPAYGAYLLKFYCWQRKQLFVNLLKLLVVAFATVAVSFGPFLNQIPQVTFRGCVICAKISFRRSFPDCFHSNVDSRTPTGPRTSGLYTILQTRRDPLCTK